MFTELLKEINLKDDTQVPQISPDSFFVGDAAGRPASVKVRKDFSASDRKLAINLGLTFYTPEELFKNTSAGVFELDGFDPRSFTNPEETDHLFMRAAPQEIVLLVGSPASGKSTYFTTFLQPLAYVRVNQDILKTRQRCLDVAKDNLREGCSVCIDNTNANKETRAVWLALAAQMQVPVRVVHFTANIELCQHNNAVRAFAPNRGEEKRELLPGIAFSSFAGRYEEPVLEEGFSRVDTVPFIFRGTTDEITNWRQFWT